MILANVFYFKLHQKEHLLEIPIESIKYSELPESFRATISIPNLYFNSETRISRETGQVYVRYVFTLEFEGKFYAGNTHPEWMESEDPLDEDEIDGVYDQLWRIQNLVLNHHR